jgi:hypothetical protein
VTPDLQQRYLYVFLDEAGDPNFSATGTKFFTVSSITKTRTFSWDTPMISLKHDLIETGIDLEYFHASEDRQCVRDKVFRIVCDNLSDARLDSIIIEKRKTWPALREMEKFYPRMLGYLLRYVLEKRNLSGFAGVIVITDSIPIKRRRESVEKAIKQTISKILPVETKYRIFHHASKSCIGLQIADYCNWAIFRKWEREDLRSYELIKRWVKSEFEIFKSGDRYYY